MIINFLVSQNLSIFPTVLYRLGFTLSGKCQPNISLLSSASELDWTDIRGHWHYDDLVLGGLSGPIPTLEEWITEFVTDPRLKLIWLDIKVENEDEIKTLIRSICSILSVYQVTLHHKVQFSAHSEVVGHLVQLELMKLGQLELAAQVVVDTVPYTSFIGDVNQYNAIDKARSTSSKWLNVNYFKW